MNGYLLDTCAVCAYWDLGHPFHAIARAEVDAIPTGSPQFVSCVTLGEIEFGILLDEVATGHKNVKAAAGLELARKYSILDITKHTAHEYAELRKNIAQKYLAKFSKANRPRWIDLWPDRVTGETLQIDENDVWICAQARERNLVVITTDKKMVEKISPADPLVHFKLLKVA